MPDGVMWGGAFTSSLQLDIPREPPSPMPKVRCSSHANFSPTMGKWSDKAIPGPVCHAKSERHPSGSLPQLQADAGSCLTRTVPPLPSSLHRSVVRVTVLVDVSLGAACMHACHARHRSRHESSRSRSIDYFRKSSTLEARAGQDQTMCSASIGVCPLQVYLLRARGTRCQVILPVVRVLRGYHQLTITSGM
jgi:hypothetical protein